MTTKKTLPILFVLALLGQLIFAHFALAAPDGNCSGHAWGEKVGFIKMSGANYGATVTDSNLSNYAWGEKTGWIKFSGTCGTPGGCPGEEDAYGVVNDGNGNLSGYAWGEKIGWIRFFSDSPSYQVTIDSEGKFNGYAWGEKTGWISFKHDTPYVYGATTGWTASGEGEAVPEFTTITFIIAAVAGFGIYFLIKRRKEKATS